MTNEKILSKAISKAKGYQYGCIVFPEVLKDKNYYPIIFSHEFAKAFWGEAKPIYRNNGKRTCLKTPSWREHLMFMVTEKEPLLYLEKFLK